MSCMACCAASNAPGPAGSPAQRPQSRLTADSYTDERFYRVLRAFRQNFADGREDGAQLCCYYQGRSVVDIAAGASKPAACGAAATLMARDTLVCIFSTSKVLTSLCMAVAVDKVSHSSTCMHVDEMETDHGHCFAPYARSLRVCINA